MHFPMIGKNFRVGGGRDSSHKGYKGHKAGGKKSGREAGGGNPQEHHAPRFADIERREGSGWPVGARSSRPRFPFHTPPASWPVGLHLDPEPLVQRLRDAPVSAHRKRLQQFNLSVIAPEKHLCGRSSGF